MIVTLTANPSHDRTVNLDAPLERGAVQRAESVISQAGGKGVNISRACAAPSIPRSPCCRPPTDDPFVLELLAAGIDCRPVPTTRGDLRVNITDHRARRHHHQAQQPGAAGDAADCSTRSPRRSYGRAAHRRLDRAGRLAAARRPPPVVRRAGHRAAAAAAPGRRRHLRRPARPRSTRSSTAPRPT